MYLKHGNKEKDAGSGPCFNSKWTASFKPLVWKIGNCTYRQSCQTTLNVRMRTDKTISFLHAVQLTLGTATIPHSKTFTSTFIFRLIFENAFACFWNCYCSFTVKGKNCANSRPNFDILSIVCHLRIPQNVPK